MAGKKGVILEVGDGWAIVLLPGGDFRKIRSKDHLEVGQLYHYENNRRLKYLSLAAILLLMVIASFDFFTVRAWAHLSPGIDLGLNRWDRVVAVEAKQNTLPDSSLKGKRFNHVIEAIVQEQVIESGTVEVEQNHFSVSLSIKNDDDEKKEKLFTLIESCLRDSVAKSKDKSDHLKVIRKGNELRLVDKTADSGKSSKPNDKGASKKEDKDPSISKNQQKLEQNVPKRVPGVSHGNNKTVSKPDQFINKPDKNKGNSRNNQTDFKLNFKNDGKKDDSKNKDMKPDGEKNKKTGRDNAKNTSDKANTKNNKNVSQ
ncbi:MAG: anti-sigma factor domain-containing protein [Syntrophomonadaceae bacterium]|jgi:thiamine phosphate synthase YjbQ (UPF0047 family)